MSNPFDDQDGTLLAVVNDAGRHSLWPAFAPCPDGWQAVLGATPRESVAPAAS
ncbi:MbtH family protein [Streptomyces hundungensis]|uniref:MbtH family protein n=1 Tax=Streptomyces hundungensis TaxID=1077946 RepID=UPI0033D47214